MTVDSETLATAAPAEAAPADAPVADKVDTPAAPAVSGAAPAATEGEPAVSADAGKTAETPAEPAPFDWKVLAGEDADALTLLGDYKTPADLLAIVKASKADWRLKYAGDDPEALKRLQRHKDEASFFKSYRSMESKMGDKEYIRKPSDKATPEEVAEYRKAMGVPEKVEDYKINLPEGAPEPTDLDRAITENFVALAHKEGYSQRQVDAALAAFEAGRVIAKQYTEEAIINARKNAEDELRTKWPNKEYRANLDLVNRVIGDYKDYLPNDFLKTKIEGGGQIGDHVPFIEWLAELGRERYGAGPMIAGEPMEATSVKDKIEKMKAKIDTPEWYKPDFQKQLNDLYAIQERINGRMN